MKYKIAIIYTLLILCVKNIKSQDNQLVNEIESPIDSILTNIEYAKNTINKNLVILDSLFNNDEIDNVDYLTIGKFLLKIKNPDGYKMLLSNFSRYKYSQFMSPTDIMNGGEVFILDIVLKTATLDERKSLVDYLFYSNYLNQKINEEELEYIQKLFHFFRDEYHEKYIKRAFILQKEANFKIIFKE